MLAWKIPFNSYSKKSYSNISWEFTIWMSWQLGINDPTKGMLADGSVNTVAKEISAINVHLCYCNTG